MSTIDIVILIEFGLFLFIDVVVVVLIARKVWRRRPRNTRGRPQR